MNAKTLEAIRKHGENLLAIFPRSTEQDPVALCKKLRRIENQAHALSTAWCNGDIDQDAWDSKTDRIIERLETLLGFSTKDLPVFVNGDARGYALKIHDHWVSVVYRGSIYTDWGGYGILAPDLTV